MVIAKDRHADRATRLEKALDDEASADRTELEQGIAPIGLNFIKASMKRSTGYGVCSLQQKIYSHLFLKTKTGLTSCLNTLRQEASSL